MSLITMTDGAQVDVRDTGGDGDVVLLLHGWSQSRATWDRLVPELSGDFRVVSIDQRGHGVSPTPAHGARIARLAKDVHEVLAELDIHTAHAIGHSMGASVLWSFIDQFGTSALSSLVVVDQPSACTALPWMRGTEGSDAGAILDFAGAEGFVAGVLGPDGPTIRRDFLRSMLSPDISDADFDLLLAENLRVDAEFGARLLLDHVMQDWRDVLPRIDVPTLVVGGEVSHVDAASQAWTADHVEGARLKVFTREDGGAHFPFFEVVLPFAAELKDFLSAARADAPVATGS